MKNMLKLTVKRLGRSQRGQSIVLLAFACIALVAFVGLVTDVALLFVRYAALRRAVDAAAIAAAGQIRENTSYGEVALAAEQYIELHNLDSQGILVETCETDIYQWRAGLGPWDGEPHTEGTNPKVTGNTDSALDMPETELCNWDDPHKLVRVSAQIKSPTPFLSIIGIKGITLEATSVSETAVLDVALVIDTSESMAVDTTVSDYESLAKLSTSNPGAGGRNIRTECFTTSEDLLNEYELLSKERWAYCCNDPGTGLVSDGTVPKVGGGILGNGYIWHDANGNGQWDNATEDGVESSTRASGAGNKRDIDRYNYNALICRPFKDVRDAARMFIKQLDFVRGDRVALVTYDRLGIAYDPDGTAANFRPLIRSEQVAVETLNRKVGVWINDDLKGRYDVCYLQDFYQKLWNPWWDAGRDPATEPALRPLAYETLASCGNTNTGGGILAASNALTDPLDIRREAVWVIVLLTDGTANVTNTIPGAVNAKDYGLYGYCPWYTFCDMRESSNTHYPECTENDNQTEPLPPICNDNNPDTRHFCIDWTTGQAEVGNPECGYTGHYDADDYARDMADFAGLIEIVPDGKKGNFIAMFSIGFGTKAITEEAAAPLMRYIADAGDNGFIDNNLQQDWRDNHQLDFGDYTRYGDPDPCEKNPPLDPRVNCGQYYYASNLETLTKVFEDIASRMFTRLSR